MWKDKILNWYYGLKYPWFKDWYWSFPKGWFKAFGKYMLEDIDSILKLCYPNRCTIKIFDIKEKYGALRFYYDCDYIPSKWDKEYSDEDMEYLNRYYDAIGDVVEAYSHISEHVCMICGALHTPINSLGGYIVPICKKCCDNEEIYADYNPIDDGLMKDYYIYKKYDPDLDRSIEVMVSIKLYLDKVLGKRKG